MVVKHWERRTVVNIVPVYMAGGGYCGCNTPALGVMLILVSQARHWAATHPLIT